MKYEYIGEQSITIHGIGEAGARMRESRPNDVCTLAAPSSRRQSKEFEMQCKIELPEPTLVYEHKPTGLKLYHYTAEQVRAAILAERERCARVCEELRDKALSAQHGRSDDLQNVMLRQVAHTGAGECAAAIRRGSV